MSWRSRLSRWLDRVFFPCQLSDDPDDVDSYGRVRFIPPRKDEGRAYRATCDPSTPAPWGPGGPAMRNPNLPPDPDDPNPRLMKPSVPTVPPWRKINWPR